MIGSSLPWILLTMLASGCARAEPTSPLHGELGTSHVTPIATSRPQTALQHQTKMHHHMNQRLDDLREVRKLLVAGRLAEAQALSFMLSQPAEEPALPSWSAESIRLSAAARSVARASSIDEACRRLILVATLCADCHVRMNAQTDVRVLDHAHCHPVPE